jgi:hypothetical protein
VASISVSLHIGRVTIIRHLDDAKVVRRDDRHRNGSVAQRLTDPQAVATLRDLYVAQGKSMQTIAGLLGLSQNGVWRMLEGAGIPRRATSTKRAA